MACLSTRCALAIVAALPVSAFASGPANDDWQATYRHRRMEIRSPGGGWIFEPQIRIQTRYSRPAVDNPTSIDDLRDASDGELEVQRSRFKLDVQLGLPSLGLYSETELQGMNQLDLRVTWEPDEAFGMRVGQWKPEYNRERRDSSGEQQFVDRSIVNRDFTLDRQQGLMLFGRIGAGTAHDLSGWVGAFGGAGRGRFNDGGRDLSMARLQWNTNGVVLPFSQADLERRETPAGSVAVALARNRSRYTRFSSDGGGALEGYPVGDVDQYDIRQWVFETAFHWRGFSWQQEWHDKDVEDRLGGGRQRLRGFYAQAGYFMHERWPAFPRPLELALRYAQVDPGRDGDGTDHEASIAANWYFDGHRNKLNFDLARMEANEGGETERGWIARLQWDVSF